MLKSVQVAGVAAILCLAGNAQAMGTPREISLRQAQTIALHYAPGHLISAVHGRDDRGGRYMFEIASRGIVREVDVNAQTGRPHTAHVLSLTADAGDSSHPRFPRPDESIRR